LWIICDQPAGIVDPHRQCRHSLRQAIMQLADNYLSREFSNFSLDITGVVVFFNRHMDYFPRIAVAWILTRLD
jgi:hypothetical protein